MKRNVFTLAEVFSTHFAGQRKYAFTLAEVFSTHFAGQRKYAFTLAEVFSTHFAGQRKCAFTLAEVFSTHFAEKHKIAFTLAEVLITLGIIGVVAAMTLPALITKYEKKQTAVRLKQTYTQLQEAMTRSIAENGEVKYWDFNQENWFEIYLVKYLKLSKNNTEFKFINAEGYIPYRQISGSQEVGLAVLREGFGGSAYYVLANGVQLLVLKKETKGSGSIFIDLNTSMRKPNQFGKDTFVFGVREDGLWPSGLKPTSECPMDVVRDRNFLMNNSCTGYRCNKNGRGMWCGALIMVDGWEIKDDYPW